MCFSLLLLAPPVASLASPLLGHLSLLLQQLSREGARDPQPRKAESLHSLPPLEEQVTEKAAKHSCDSTAECYLLPGGSGWQSKFQGLGIFHPSLGDTSKGSLLSESGTVLTLSDLSRQSYRGQQRGEAECVWGCVLLAAELPVCPPVMGNKRAVTYLIWSQWQRYGSPGTSKALDGESPLHEEVCL